MVCGTQTAIGMVADEKVGSSFRNSNLRLQGTVAGSIFGFLASVAFRVPFASFDFDCLHRWTRLRIPVTLCGAAAGLAHRHG
jgi:hypothetical protein